MTVKSFFKQLNPTDYFAIFAFFFSPFIPDWWFRKSLFMAGLLMLIITYVIRYFPIKGRAELTFDVLDTVALLYGAVLIFSLTLSKFPEYSVNIILQNEGLITNLAYIIAFIVLRRIFRPKRFHFYLFIAAILTVIMIEILTCCGIIPQTNTENSVTTYSNFNMLTQILSIAFAVNFLLSIKKQSFKFSAVHGVSAFFILLGIILARSDGGIICLLFFFLLLPFVVKINTPVIRRIFETASAFAFAFGVTRLLYLLSAGWVSILDNNILISLAVRTPSYLSLSVAVMLFIWAEFLLPKKDKSFTLVYRIVSVSLSVILLALFVAFGITTGWRFYGFADEWLSTRGAVLSMGFNTYFTGLSVPEKLFGTGYNSFGIYIMTYFPDIIPESFNTAFLIPHSFVLQTLFETGLFGFAGYVSIYGKCIYSGLKNKTETSVICLCAVAVYLVSMLFYVPSPEVTVPVIFFLAGLCPSKKNFEIFPPETPETKVTNNM